MDESTAAIGFHSLSSHARFLYNLVPGQIHFARYEQSPLAQRPKKKVVVAVVVFVFVVVVVFVVGSGDASLLCCCVVFLPPTWLGRTYEGLLTGLQVGFSWLVLAMPCGHAVAVLSIKHALLYTTSHSSSRHCFLRLLACYTRSLQSVPVGRATCFPSSHLSHARCSMPRFRSSNSE